MQKKTDKLKNRRRKAKIQIQKIEKTQQGRKREVKVRMVQGHRQSEKDIERVRE